MYLIPGVLLKVCDYCVLFNEIPLGLSPFLKIKALITIINLRDHLIVLAKQMHVSIFKEDHALASGILVMDTDAHCHDCSYVRPWWPFIVLIMERHDNRI